MIQNFAQRLQIVVLEDNSERREAMMDCLRDRFARYDIVLFATAVEMIDHLRRHPDLPLVIALDHDLDLVPIAGKRVIDPGTGRDVADYLASQSPNCPVVIHSSNVPAVTGMIQTLEESGWSVSRVIPDADTRWIRQAWITAIRNAIVSAVAPATVHSDHS